jgi:hypothetical protein
MINDPRFRDPLYPHSPGLGQDYDQPFNRPPEIHSGSGRATFAIAIMLVALLVAGLVVFSGSGEVDPMQTASPGIERQNDTLPGNTPATPIPEPAAPAE